MIGGILKGGGLFGIGAFGGALFQILIVSVTTRYLDKASFGLLSYCLAIVNVCTFISMLGFGNGLPYYMGKNTYRGEEKVATLGFTALSINVFASLIITAVVFVFVGYTSEPLRMHKDALLFKSIFFMIPPMVVISSLVAFYRGKKSVAPKIYFRDIFLFAARFGLLFPLTLFMLPLVSVVTAYTVSTWIACLAFLIYALPEFKKELFRIDQGIIGKLLSFSLPLMGNGALNMVMTWGLTFSLAIYFDTIVIANYSAPLRIVPFLIIPLQGILFIYLPQVTQLREKGKDEAVGALYVSISKWLIIITLPVFFALILSADTVTTILFGVKYSSVSPIFQVLVLGVALNSLFGPSGVTLVAMGNPKLVFYGTFLGVVFTLIGSVTIVPAMGAYGAAIVYAVSIFVINLVVAFFLYRLYGMHLLRRDIIFPLLVFSVSSLGACYLLKPYLSGLLVLFAFSIILYALIIAAWFVTSSFSEDEKVLWNSILDKVKCKFGSSGC